MSGIFMFTMEGKGVYQLLILCREVRLVVKQLDLLCSALHNRLHNDACVHGAEGHSTNSVMILHTTLDAGIVLAGMLVELFST